MFPFLIASWHLNKGGRWNSSTHLILLWMAPISQKSSNPKLVPDLPSPTCPTTLEHPELAFDYT
jgi:hypothetical protein